MLFGFSKKSSLILVVVHFVLGFLPFVTVYATKLIIDQLIDMTNVSGFTLQNTPLFFALVLMVSCQLLGLIFRNFNSWLEQIHAQILTDELCHAIHQKSLKLPYPYFENTSYFDTLHRAQDEAQQRCPHIIQNVLGLFEIFILLAGAFIMFFKCHYLIALGLFASMLPALILRLKNSEFYLKEWNELTPLERRADYYSTLMLFRDYAKEARVFGFGDWVDKRFRGFRNTILLQKKRILKRICLSDFFMDFVLTVTVLLSLLFLGYQAVSGVITLGTVVMFVQLFFQAHARLGRSFSSMVMIYENGVFLENLFVFFDYETEVENQQSGLDFKTSCIEVKNVSFSYTDEMGSVIKDCSFCVPMGKKVLIIGGNGEGKSTLLKLVAGMFQVTEGEITVAGNDINKISLEQKQQLFSVMWQDYPHYNLPVKQGISISQTLSMDNRERIEEVAKICGIHDVIKSLPLGYESLLGKEFEKGHELSGGEWQKVALARVLFKESEIYLLDEPTSQFDQKAEMECFRKVFDFLKGKTVIVVSHHQQLRELFDEVILIQNGQAKYPGCSQDVVES
jgi:ATP-binding cassette subfamily B protein